MEEAQETISSRWNKLRAQIRGKSVENDTVNLINSECLLDALQALFNKCCKENAKNYDWQFVEKYENTILELKRLRVNVNDFDIKGVIGTGAFGKVYLVKEKQTGDTYAMKTMEKSISVRTSFDVERDIMAYAQSPWITSLRYAFQNKNYLFFVMEYHPRGNLLRLMKKQGGKLPESAATFYLAEIALALEDLHAMGFVHRDITVVNLLLDGAGHVKLADFGSAARINSQGCNSSAAYDYWRLGVLAYELTFGETPEFKNMNQAPRLNFPPNVPLTQAYISFITELVTNEYVYLSSIYVKQHVLFKTYDFGSLRDQVPPYLPEVTSYEVTGIEDFEKDTKFPEDLPFIGFTFTRSCDSSEFKDFEEKTHKLKSTESAREKLEEKIPACITENTASKNTLEIRSQDLPELLQLEAVDINKRETTEGINVQAPNVDIEQHNEKITPTEASNFMLAVYEEETSDLEMTVKSYEKQTKKSTCENTILKEEISQNLTHIDATKAQIQDLISAKYLLEKKVEKLESELDAKISYYEEKESNQNFTIEQLTKLSACLQVKVDELIHKKKNLPDKLFGYFKKENQETISLPLNIDKALQENINQLKADLDQKSTTLRKSEITSLEGGNLDSSIIIEGWIKVLNKNHTWKNFYACLTNSHLNIFSSSVKNSSSLVESFELSSNNRKEVVRDFLLPETETGAASSNPSFIMKVEIFPEDSPLVSLAFTALSMADTDKWYNALQRLFALDKYNLKSVLSVPIQIHINCIFDVTQKVKVLGTKQGLFSCDNHTYFHIKGPTEVRHICVIPESTVVLMIAGLNNVLISCDWNHLVNVAECTTRPFLIYKKVFVNHLYGFHHLQASDFNQMVCAATSKQLVIMKYGLDTNSWSLLRIINTSEPLACALFTEQSLIIGTSKLFKIDLRTFQTQEFLDSSDVNLMHIVKCHKTWSFPLAIVQVFDNPTEYLLCFNNFSVFVDEYGRRSRSTEIKTSYIPQEFHFIEPYLYVIHFSGVEIWKLNVSKDGVDVSQMILVDSKNIRCLGQNMSGIYLLHDENIRFWEGRQLAECDVTTDVSQSTEDKNGENIDI